MEEIISNYEITIENPILDYFEIRYIDEYDEAEDYYFYLVDHAENGDHIQLIKSETEEVIMEAVIEK